MADRVTELLPAIQSHRITGISLPEGQIYPGYRGRSILNLPASVCRWLGAPDFPGEPLAQDLLEAVGAPLFSRVILIVMDALALHRLRRWMSDSTTPVWQKLSNQGLLAPLTSVVPSTTSAALTSFWTGRSPAEHGVVGYELWLREYGVVANTILYTPMSFNNDPGGLVRAGFNSQAFLPFKTLGVHLAAQGVESYAFQHHSLQNSQLSQMLFKEVRLQGCYTAADLWINLRDLLENRPSQRLYAWVYWSEVDTFSHRYGPDDERTAAEFASFSAAFEKYFLAQLGSHLRKDTLLILTADHGAISTQPDPHYELRNHPNFTRRLHIDPTGEHRLAYLHIRPGQTEAVREYIARTWGTEFFTLDPSYAVESGLFGPGDPHPRLIDRMGDLIALARGNAYWWWSEKENRLAGRHGSLSPDEMLVPFLAARL